MGINNIISTEIFAGLPVTLVEAIPEFSLLCLATLVLLIDAYLPRKVTTQSEQLKNAYQVENYKLTFWLTCFALIVTLGLLILQHMDYLNQFFNSSSEDVARRLVANTIINDDLAYILKIFMVTFVFFSFYFSESYMIAKNMFSGEYYAMGLFSLLGMMVLVSSQNMLSLYIGLELFSLPVYAMVAMQRDSESAGESALKYFVMGAIASSILLFGISLTYGISGSIIFTEIAKFNELNFVAYNLGLVFICVGIAFKFGAAPFHMWMPDVYQGAPTPTTLFISTAPKLAATGMAIRLLSEGFVNLGDSWGYILQLIAILSVAWGNIAAIAQTNLKRLLAYSGISHMGFIILGLVAASTFVGDAVPQGFAAALFYSITYSLVSLGTFGFILMLGNGKYELTSLEDYKGLYYRKPWFAFLLLILVFSMAGVPPFVGFFAKLLVIKSLVAAGYVSTAIIAVLFSVIGAFYYLRLIWLMFFEKPLSEITEDNLMSSNDVMNTAMGEILVSRKIVVSINCLLVLGLGIYGQWLIDWCMTVFN